MSGRSCWLVLVMLASCGEQLVDPCAPIPSACLSVQIEPSPAVKTIDRATIELKEIVGIDRTKDVVSEPLLVSEVGGDGTLTLPVAVALVFYTDSALPRAVSVTVSGFRDRSPSGTGSETLYLYWAGTTSHATAWVELW